MSRSDVDAKDFVSISSVGAGERELLLVAGENARADVAFSKLLVLGSVSRLLTIPTRRSLVSPDSYPQDTICGVLARGASTSGSMGLEGGLRADGVGLWIVSSSVQW